jgi:alkaline phosphatase
MRRIATSLLTIVAVAVLALPAVPLAQSRARNVVLFLADAGGIPTINAASWHGYGKPQQLFIQHMPYIGLSDTSPSGGFVTDSAAGMTAIVTGQKTRNGVISQSPDAVRRVSDGQPLKSILEYAEEQGLSTGIITNDALTGATPAALYAKANDRNMTAAIFQQAFAPRFGDGPDVMIGAGREAITKALTAAELDLDTLTRAKGRPVLGSLDEIGPQTSRAIVLLDSGEFDLQQAIDKATQILSRNPKGYFLMVEWDSHTDKVREGLEHVLQIDRAVGQTARTAGPDTLILFTADHSFDLRVRGEADASGPLLAGLEEAEESARVEKRRDVRTRVLAMENSHTGEEVLVAAQGPGADRVHGYMANTDLFGVMMDALGWRKGS